MISSISASPAAARTVVANEAFVAQLEARLADGVDVYIGWGMTKLDEPDQDIDTAAVRKEFARLSRRYRWTFRAQRSGSTHAKEWKTKFVDDRSAPS